VPLGLAPVLLVHASLTEPLVRLATHLIADLGLAGVALLTLTSGVVGAPGSEPTMLFAGFDVFQGNLTLPGIIVAGVLGDIAGASVAYAIGYFASEELVQHQGKLHIRPGSIERAHRWFDRYGTPVMFVTRFLPFIRAAFPYAAGVARMSFWRCITAATIGSIVWIGGLGLLGREVGSQWQTWRHHLEYVDYVGVVVLVAAIVYLIVRRVRDRPSEPGAGGTSSDMGGAGTAVDAVPD
jgi:membrane protein DedA with SNARE-associated domain